MRTLICHNETHDVVSVHISTNPTSINEEMRSEYEAELDSVEAEGYDLNSVDYDFNEGCDAHIIVSDDYAYYWQIVSATEV